MYESGSPSMFGPVFLFFIAATYFYFSFAQYRIERTGHGILALAGAVGHVTAPRELGR